ncbi:unnamed protein product [Plutella xylostella]|uniref:(diamondback moth) hypothetical protein n=1 Tax=Plutella xylostella TaxID=51655 RepID=A0A8S4G9M5_PLUXY|nr:unnamed protein product [Plutella xylostella]
MPSGFCCGYRDSVAHLGCLLKRGQTGSRRSCEKGQHHCLRRTRGGGNSLLKIMTCGTECLSLGSPPDSILHMPPPPLPAFLASAANLTPPCRAARCPPSPNTEENALFPGVEYHELPRHGEEPASNDDTWFLVLITCCVAVLCIAALLALFLLKCRQRARRLQERHRQVQWFKRTVRRRGFRLESVMGGTDPRGTRHFVADTYPHDETETITTSASSPHSTSLGRQKT